MSLDTLKKRESYAVGINFGNQIRHLIDMVEPDALLAGVRVILQGEQPEISVEEFQTLAKQFETKVQARMQENFQVVADKQLQEGQAFLASNKEQKGWIETESGLQYKVLFEGEGASPLISSVVKVHYEGSLLDGNIFDSSYKRGEPAVFPLNGVIKGWGEGLQLMKVGAIFDFVIPAELAYGLQGNQAIPPNAVLKFRVELLSIESDASDNTVSFDA